MGDYRLKRSCYHHDNKISNVWTLAFKDDLATTHESRQRTSGEMATVTKINTKMIESPRLQNAIATGTQAQNEVPPLVSKADNGKRYCRLGTLL